MSETYSLVCDDCRVHAWVGQDVGADRNKLFLYRSFDVDGNLISPATKFLSDHQGHKLRFLSTNEMHGGDEPDVSDYADGSSSDPS